MFLPLISAVLSTILGWWPVSPQDPAIAPTAGSPVTVVVGSGDVSPARVDRFRDEVTTGLAALEPVFGGPPRHPFFVFLHADRAGLPAALAPHLHPDSPGFALLGQHQIHIVLGELRHHGTTVRGVVVHELVHELLDQYVAPNGRYLPRWFHEGLAQHLAGDTYLGAREDDLVWRVGTRHQLSFGDLRNSFPTDSDLLRVAYAQSYSYVSWLVSRHGLDELLHVARNTDARTSFERALVGRLDRTTLQLEDAWRHHLLYGSGAPWRVMFDSCFSLLLLAALPVLVMALMRRLKAEERAGRRLAALEQQALAAAAANAEAARAAAALPPVDAEHESAAPEPDDDADPPRSTT